MGAHILLIEDEAAIADAVVYALRAEGYEVEHHLLGRAGVKRVREGGVDLVILDVGLPDITGFDACREIRGFSGVPVVFLTARAGEVDKVLGLELGADDYVVKPFSPRELVARVRARLRRAGSADLGSWRETGVFARRAGSADLGSWRETGVFAHDASGQRIRFSGQELPLTRYEYRLLAALLARPGAILSRERLMADVWHDALDTVDRTVDTHIKTLRAKLRVVDAHLDPIQTHRSLGYSLKV